MLAAQQSALSLILLFVASLAFGGPAFGASCGDLTQHCKDMGFVLKDYRVAASEANFKDCIENVKALDGFSGVQAKDSKTANLYKAIDRVLYDYNIEDSDMAGSACSQVCTDDPNSVTLPEHLKQYFQSIIKQQQGPEIQ